jgi:hypothetical protein
MYNKTVSHIILNAEELKPLSLMSGTRQGCLLYPLLFNIVLEFLAITIRGKNETRDKNRKE